MHVLSNHPTLTNQALTVILCPETPEAKFQIVVYGAGENAVPIHTCRTRGDATSWLVCNGYKWVEGSNPEKWLKIA